MSKDDPPFPQSLKFSPGLNPANPMKWRVLRKKPQVYVEKGKGKVVENK
ncbi:hypothetical protein [Ruminococcus albus]|nr:hypothetical protein [Ruminococcus albus]